MSFVLNIWVYVCFIDIQLNIRTSMLARIPTIWRKLSLGVHTRLICRIRKV